MMIPIQAAATDTIQPDMNPLPPLPYKITASSNEENRGPEDENCRKKKHREIEKQRRQEMASLFGDLRSLLPLEFIRGKRSKPDQMNDTVNYIRHLQAEIKDLQLKRDKMKKTTNLTCPDSPYGSVSSSIIVVFPWCDGVEIMIRQGSREGVFPLSGVMKLLAQEGVNVVTCSSSQVENQTLYNIRCEVNDVVSVDLTKLRWKLEGLVG